MSFPTDVTPYRKDYCFSKKTGTEEESSEKSPIKEQANKVNRYSYLARVDCTCQSSSRVLVRHYARKWERLSAGVEREASLYGKTNQASGISSSTNSEERRKKEGRNKIGVKKETTTPSKEYEIFPGGTAGRRLKKRQGPTMRPNFYSNLSLLVSPASTDFVPFCFGRERSRNSSLHEWTPTSASLIKLSGYRSSGTQLVFSRRLIVIRSRQYLEFLFYKDLRNPPILIESSKLPSIVIRTIILSFKRLFTFKGEKSI